MELRPIEPGDEPALTRFFERIPESDRTFLKEDVGDPEVLAAWVTPGPGRVVAIEDGEVVGSVAVVPLHGWSRHVGEVRLVVDPGHRGKGLGRALARRAVLDAMDMDLAKLVVEVIADQEALIGMFRVARLRAGGAPHRPRARPHGRAARPDGPRELGREPVRGDVHRRDRRQPVSAPRSVRRPRGVGFRREGGAAAVRRIQFSDADYERSAERARVAVEAALAPWGGSETCIDAYEAGVARLHRLPAARSRGR